MSWNIDKAKKSLYKIGMDQLAIGKYTLGGEFIYESQWGSGPESEDNFRYLLDNRLSWTQNDIDLAVRRITVRITTPDPENTIAFKAGWEVGFHNGYYSFDQSKTIPKENPYPDDVEDHLLWNDGYARAYSAADSDGM